MPFDAGAENSFLFLLVSGIPSNYKHEDSSPLA